MYASAYGITLKVNGPTRTHAEDSMGHHDIFQGWYERAGVRVSARRLFHDERDDGKWLFSPALLPHLEHEAVQAMPASVRDALAARGLYEYMNRTAHLEAKVVNRTTHRIALDEAGFAVAGPIRMDAWKIYCDEAFHSLMSFDMVQQVARETGIPDIPYSFDPVLDRLDAAKAELDRLRPGLGGLLQVVVFETLVTSILGDVPRDRSVVTGVREVVADHARDEARHHAFFALFFNRLWGALSVPDRAAAARVLPELVLACLEPDLRMVKAALLASDVPPATAARIVAESYPRQEVLANMRRAARQTLRLFADHDAFDLPGVEESFTEAGLIVPERLHAAP
ncbi:MULTISPECIES: diiron oxygenase [Streptomyces]|uniref:Diiron oxygenase n=1 Tax=Streptomyces cacaoi TaxID=1898 RepID=A0A4Y3QQM6_STRCI|nr:MULTISPECIES: diiron oxygenase [Streptomyces]NNG88549.1 hypothetical protein [Streptomyces cacaoi]GEB47736.1 hypothetical protein SCA03_02870 [Streptomyces cacaoi]